MFKHLIFAAITALVSLQCSATDGAEFGSRVAFPGFREVSISEKGDDMYRASVWLAPGLKYRRIAIAIEGVTEVPSVLRVTCSEDLRLEIGFDAGPSEDPAYFVTVRRGKQSSKFHEISGSDLTINARCDLFAVSDTNLDYVHHDKFEIHGMELTRIPQPFYLIDTTCEANGVVQLTSEPCGMGEPVAVLPDKSPVRILLAGQECGQVAAPGTGPKIAYLVATPFGLVGWVENEQGWVDAGKPLSCMRYLGD